MTTEKKKADKTLTTEHCEKVLGHWMRLNAALMGLDEGQCVQLLAFERRHRARLRVLLRIYHRYSRLRGIREKLELSQNAKS